MKKGSNLRVALICDWLTEIGGAEQVLLQLTKIFPDAPIYTSQYRRKSAPWFNNCDVRTGWLNIFPRCLRKFMAPLRALYFNHLHLNDYDVVISICNAECKGVKTPDSTLHIAYLQGPPTQYYWGLYDQYIQNPGFGKLNWLARIGLKLLAGPMRKSDYKSAQQPDILVANSNYVLGEINKYYNRDGVVIFPPVGVERMRQAADKVAKADVQQVKKELFGGEDFYIVAGRQVNWKRFDLAVKACVKAVENLLIVGDGPEHASLVELASDSPHIKFLPKYNGAEEITKYFKAAKGLIFPSLEPFGIIPVEALACGLPILAFAKGGSADIVEDGINGQFFAKQTVASLAKGIKSFNVAQYNRQQVAKTADRFNEAVFATAWRELINQHCETSL